MTTYRLASTPSDYRECRTLASKTEYDAPMMWPTVMAERDDKLIGMLGTLKSDEAVIAGPVAFNGIGWRERVHTLIAMVDLYDGVMKKAGMVEYLFAIPGHMTRYIAQAKRYMGDQFAIDDDGEHWFRRRLG